jgi:purine-nucleoside phosphorylase
MGMEVLGLSCVTNLAAGLGAATLSHEEVFSAGRGAEQQLTRLLERLVPRIATLMQSEAVENSRL